MHKIDYTSNFKNQLKENYEELEPKYKNHHLINDKSYRDYMECHLKPDWLLVYKYIDDNLVLLLVATGSHSQILDK